MDLEVNNRGNLVIPAPRVTQRIKAIALSACATYMVGRLNGVDILDDLFSPYAIVGFVTLGAVILLILSLTENVLEFDDARQLVVRGKTVVAKYSDISHVEIDQGTGDEALYTVALQIMITRRYLLFRSNDEADASLNAATIARTLGKPVRAAFGK